MKALPLIALGTLLTSQAVGDIHAQSLDHRHNEFQSGCWVSKT